MGEASQPGDFYYSNPNLLGTERTGPNLAKIGGKRPTVWLLDHYIDPRAVAPSSIMPTFAFLSDKERNGLVSYIQTLGGEDLEPNASQPLVPLEYRGQENPYRPLMLRIMKSFDPNTEEYTCSEADAKQWQALVEEGKALYTQKCVSCHGGAGNGQGPYGRETVAHPANLHERISNFPAPSDAYHDWRVHEGVPGTAMPPWGWSLSADAIWKINTYEMSFVNGSLRTFSGEASDKEGDKFNDQTISKPSIAGTKEQFTQGEKLFTMYCTACHGNDGKGNGPASIRSEGGYIMPACSFCSIGKQ